MNLLCRSVSRQEHRRADRPILRLQGLRGAPHRHCAPFRSLPKKQNRPEDCAPGLLSSW